MRADSREVEEKRLIAFPARLVAADSERGEGDAVIGVFPADDLPAPGAAGADVVQAGQAQGRFD